MVKPAYSILLFSLGLLSTALAANLTDDPQFSYQVAFTNPICKDYPYSTIVESVGGKELHQKPKNVYCRSSDLAETLTQPNHPQNLLTNWIRDPKTTEIFFTYLTFTNAQVLTELCEAIETRNVRITFILDRGADRGAAEKLLACKPSQPENQPKFYQRGRVRGLGFAHNKLFIVNPSSNNRLKIAFGSGNLTQGVGLHHENWSFLDVSAMSYFAQAHVCLMRGLIENGDVKAKFVDFMKNCRAKIPTLEETDLRSFFIPGDTAAMKADLREAFVNTSSLDVAAHRFSNRFLISEIENLLSAGRRVRLIADDDVYWAGLFGRNMGSNDPNEASTIFKLGERGTEVRYFETNSRFKLLHHNKYLIFDKKVFTGAGNLTEAAFKENFENFYLIEIPSAVKAFHSQYKHAWEEMATPTENLPKNLVEP